MADKSQFRVNGSAAQFIDWTFDFTDGSKSLGTQEGITELNWKESREQGESRDNGSPYANTTTSGDYSGSGSQKWEREAWDAFRDKLGKLGYGPFKLKGNITCTYKRKDGKVTKVFIEGFEYTDIDSQNAKGTDILSVSNEFKFKRLFQNGVGPFGEKLGK